MDKFIAYLTALPERDFRFGVVVIFGFLLLFCLLLGVGKAAN